MSLKKTPFFELRSGSVDTLLFVVKTTDLDALRTELTRRFEATPEFFANDTVAIDVRRLAADERLSVSELAALLDSVRMRPIGVVASGDQAWASEGALPLLEARDRRGAPKPSVDAGVENSEAAAVIEAAVAQTPAPGAPGPKTTIIDRPLRSGQQGYAQGDVAVLGLAGNAAAGIAEGHMHI